MAYRVAYSSSGLGWKDLVQNKTKLYPRISPIISIGDLGEVVHLPAMIPTYPAAVPLFSFRDMIWAGRLACLLLLRVTPGVGGEGQVIVVT